MVGRHAGPRWLLVAGLAGCVIHAGVAPSTAQYAEVEVTGTVAEPGIVEALGASVEDALARAGAWAPGAADPVVVPVVVPQVLPVVVDVVAAHLDPWRRGEGGLLYRARLVIHVEAGPRARTFVVEREVADPGSASAAVGARAAVFRDLAGEAAERAAAWLAGGG